MFNLLVSGGSSTWDTGQPWSMLVERFKEYSGSEANDVYAKQPARLKGLEHTRALFTHEMGSTATEA